MWMTELNYFKSVFHFPVECVLEELECEYRIQNKVQIQEIAMAWAGSGWIDRRWRTEEILQSDLQTEESEGIWWTGKLVANMNYKDLKLRLVIAMMLTRIVIECFK